MKTTHRGFIVPLLLIIVAILLAGGGAYVYMQNKPTNLEGTFIAIDPIYSSGIGVTSEQDVEKVFNTYINWARQNNQTAFGLPNATDFKYKGAQEDGIYRGVLYWKMKFSQPAESGNIFDTYVDVSEKGEIVGFLRGV